MGKIIPFRSNLYVNQLNDTKEHLEEIAETLFEDAINIASKGKWQQWIETNAKDGESIPLFQKICFGQRMI